MRIVIRRWEDVALLTCSGDFVTSDLGRVSAKLDTLIESGHTKFAFDLRRLTLINSAALACVIRTKKRVDERGGDVVIVRPSEFVRKTLLTLGLDQLMRIFDDTFEALVFLNPEAEHEKIDLSSLPVETLGEPTAD